MAWSRPFGSLRIGPTSPRGANGTSASCPSKTSRQQDVEPSVFRRACSGTHESDEPHQGEICGNQKVEPSAENRLGNGLRPGIRPRDRPGDSLLCIHWCGNTSGLQGRETLLRPLWSGPLRTRSWTGCHSGARGPVRVGYVQGEPVEIVRRRRAVASFPSARISMRVFSPSVETESLAAPVARLYPRIRRVVVTSTFPPGNRRIIGSGPFSYARGVVRSHSGSSHVGV